MRDYIARLISCGIPRVTALVICRYFKRERSLLDLERYVEDVERECYVSLADV